jgi:uncharacterized membrane protein YjfL (UPF0719 family)
MRPSDAQALTTGGILIGVVVVLAIALLRSCGA